MSRCTRNKIAQSVPAALRELPLHLRSSLRPRNRTRVSKNLDEIDLKSLAEIQADGRITNVELAKRVGISPPPCLRRVRTLEEEGYILGYRGLLDPRFLGLRFFFRVSLHRRDFSVQLAQSRLDFRQSSVGILAGYTPFFQCALN